MRHGRAVLTLSLIVAATVVLLARDWATDSPCREPRMAQLQLEREERLAPLDHQPGDLWLCLGYHSDGDSYVAFLSPIDTRQDSRTAKVVAAQRRQSIGFDPCRVAFWTSSPVMASPRDGMEDILGSVDECAPRVVAGDPGAEQWLPDVQAAAQRAVEVTARDLGWRPTRPLTIVVVTNEDAAVAAYRHYVLSGHTAPDEYVARIADHYDRLAHLGASTFAHFTAAGSLIMPNLSPKLQWDASGAAMQAAIRRTITHEYTHFAQDVLLGSGGVPRWFTEGQAGYRERRADGATYENLMLAVSGQQDGTAPRLSQLIPHMGWDTHDEADQTAAVYARSYAALAFLVERYGFPATVQLLRDNRDGTYGHFQALLTSLTGLDLDALDDALGVWLLAPGRVVFRDEFATPSGYWPRWSSSRVQQGYEGQEYSVAVLPENDGETWALVAMGPAELQAEVDVRLMPPSEGALLWLEWARPPYDHFDAFTIDPSERTFALQHRTGGDWSPAVAWNHSPAIAEGTATNRLKLRVQGPEATLWANGAEVARVALDADEPGSGAGLFMLSVSHREHGRAEARFSQFVLSIPD
jgi:hypothetical protein